MVSAYYFGRAASIKLAQGPQGQRPAPQPAPPPSGLPQSPTSTWGGYLTDTNNGLMKDVGDYFTHSVPQNIPGTDAYATRGERFKNLPVDRALGYGATAAAGTAAVSGLAAAGAAAVPAIGGMAVSSLPGAVTGAATAGAQQVGAGIAAAGTAAGAGAQRFGTAVNNMATRLPQTAQNAMTRVNQGVQAYNDNVKPVLEKLDYKPQDIAMDGMALATGNVDKIKGPGWGKLPAGSMPLGAPSVPRPYEFARTMRDQYSGSTNTGLMQAGAIPGGQ